MAFREKYPFNPTNAIFTILSIGIINRSFDTIFVTDFVQFQTEKTYYSNNIWSDFYHCYLYGPDAITVHLNFRTLMDERNKQFRMWQGETSYLCDHHYDNCISIGDMGTRKESFGSSISNAYADYGWRGTPIRHTDLFHVEERCWTCGNKVEVKTDSFSLFFMLLY